MGSELSLEDLVMAVRSEALLPTPRQSSGWSSIGAQAAHPLLSRSKPAVFLAAGAMAVLGAAFRTRLAVPLDRVQPQPALRLVDDCQDECGAGRASGGRWPAPGRIRPTLRRTRQRAIGRRGAHQSPPLVRIITLQEPENSVLAAER